MTFSKWILKCSIISYPLTMTLLILSKLEESYNMEFLISGVCLSIFNVLGIIIHCCKNKKVNIIEQK